MSPKRGGAYAGGGALDAVENGIITMFSSRVLAIFGDWAAFDLILAGFAILVLKRVLDAERDRVRMIETAESVVKGIVLKIALDSTADRELVVHATHLLCMFLLLHAFDANGLDSTAKYVFASQVAQAFAGDQFLGMAICIALQVNMAALSATPRLKECAQLVVTQLVVQWFQASIPDGMELPTTLLLIYTLSPLLDAGGGAGPNRMLSSLYTFALYQASSAVQLPGRDTWVQAAFAAGVWRSAPDPVTSLIGQFSSIQMVSQIILDASGAEIRTDPLLAMGGMVAGLGIVLELTR